MRLNRALDPATKVAMLNWTDEEGRTALMWAAQKNHLHVAQLVRTMQVALAVKAAGPRFLCRLVFTPPFNTTSPAL
jgi:hypothetical protein